MLPIFYNIFTIVTVVGINWMHNVDRHFHENIVDSIIDGHPPGNTSSTNIRKKRETLPFKYYHDFALSMESATFDDWIKCNNYFLKKYYNTLPSSNLPTQRLMFMGGQEIMLRCFTCLRPDQNNKDYEYIWTLKRYNSRLIKRIYIDGTRYAVPNAMPDALHIKQLSLKTAGIFSCYAQSVKRAIYEVYVIHLDKRTSVSSYERLIEAKPSADTTVEKLNIRIYTTWGSWSNCSQCNLPGLKRRIGICTVGPLDSSKPYDNIFKHFVNGVPCHSSALPRKYRDLEIIEVRQSETEYRKCEEGCNTKSIFTRFLNFVFKGLGTGIKNVFNFVTKKVVHLGGKLMKYISKPKPPIRVSIYPFIGRTAILVCPTSIDVKYYEKKWTNVTQVINSQNIVQLTKGRVYISSLGDLVLRPVKEWDKTILICDQGPQHIITYKVLPKVYARSDIFVFTPIIALFMVFLFLLNAMWTMKSSYYQQYVLKRARITLRRSINKPVNAISL